MLLNIAVQHAAKEGYDLGDEALGYKHVRFRFSSTIRASVSSNRQVRS